jgi:hypothetical protein
MSFLDAQNLVTGGQYDAQNLVIGGQYDAQNLVIGGQYDAQNLVTGGQFEVHDPHEGKNYPPARSPMLPPNVRLPKLQIDYLQSGEAYMLVKTGVSNLTNDVKIIEERFAAISRDMKALDNLDVSYDDIGKSIALQSHWAEIHDVFISLI